MISSLARTKTFVAAGGTVPVSLNFPFADAADLRVTSQDGLLPPVDLVQNVHYDIGGTVTQWRAGTGTIVPINLAAGLVVRVDRMTNPLQSYDPQAGIALDHKALGAALDKVVMRVIDAGDVAEDTLSRALVVPRGEQVQTLPSAAERANRFQAYGPTGAPIASNGLGTDPGLRADLGDETDGLGAGLIMANLDIADAEVGLLETLLRNLAVAPEQALAIGESVAVDALPAIRRVLAEGRPVRLSPGVTYVVEYDPASDIGGGSFSYALKIPSNAVIFCDGGTIKLADEAPNWCRAVTLENAANVRVYGVLKVDGNAANVAAGNEHMHGVFLYNTTNFYIEAIDCRNCFGDNVYIGGADNTRGSCDGYIGRIVGVTAGRKNLVGQAFDNVHIGSAWLDNSLGGSTVTGNAPDATDGNCLDIEPDSFDGSVKNRIWIGQLYTRGAGNDFTAGTAVAQAEAMIVNIGKWVIDIVPRAGVPWHTQYGITLNIDDLIVSGITATSATAELYYSARLFAKRKMVNGVRADASTPFMLIAHTGGHQPEIAIDDLVVSGLGAGFENRDGRVTINNYTARTGGVAFWNRGLAGGIGELTINVLDVENVGDPGGAGYGFLVSKDPNAPVTRIGHIRFRDTRTPKLNYIGRLTPGVCAGMIVGSVDNNTAVPLFLYDGPDSFYRIAGGAVGAPGDYVCVGTPEAMIAAPVGSTARRVDGGAATSLYIKEANATVNGWVGK